MKNLQEDDDMPAEIDFAGGVRGVHHIPSDAKVFMPASREPSGNTSPIERAKKASTSLSFSRKSCGAISKSTKR